MSHWIRARKTLNVQKNVGKSTQSVSMVCGYYEKIRKKIRMSASADDLFVKACELAGVKRTVRQFNKFNRGAGAAFKCRTEARALVQAVQA